MATVVDLINRRIGAQTITMGSTSRIRRSELGIYTLTKEENLNLIYPVNFVGYDRWTTSGWRQDLASGDVITRDGEVMGTRLAVDYDTTKPDAGGRYEFIPNGQSDAIFTVSFAILDSRAHTGLALSEVSRKVLQWYKLHGGTIS